MESQLGEISLTTLQKSKLLVADLNLWSPKTVSKHNKMHWRWCSWSKSTSQKANVSFANSKCEIAIASKPVDETKKLSVWPPSFALNINLLNASITKTNSKGERRSPCHRRRVLGKNTLGVPLIMIRESYLKNTKSNPAPNFQWTHCRFIGNNLPSQIYYVLFMFSKTKNLWQIYLY